MKTIPVPDSVRSIDLEVSIAKLCPFADETDYGKLTIWFESTGKTFELAGLSRRLKRYAQIAISHEDLVDEVLQLVVKELRPVNAVVVGSFVTAGICVDVKARYHQPSG